MKVDHIARAVVPWHEPATMTECGRRVEDVASLVARDEVVARVKREGKQRVLYSTCQTCVSTVQNHETWHQNPVAVASRHFAALDWEATDQQKAEVLAIAALIEAHREEFDEFINGFGQTSDLASVRRQKQRTERWAGELK